MNDPQPKENKARKIEFKSWSIQLNSTNIIHHWILQTNGLIDCPRKNAEVAHLLPLSCCYFILFLFCYLEIGGGILFFLFFCRMDVYVVNHIGGQTCSSASSGRVTKVPLVSHWPNNPHWKTPENTTDNNCLEILLKIWVFFFFFFFFFFFWWLHRFNGQAANLEALDKIGNIIKWNLKNKETTQQWTVLAITSLGCNFWSKQQLLSKPIKMEAILQRANTNRSFSSQLIVKMPHYFPQRSISGVTFK